jgi:hypothetical protein
MSGNIVPLLLYKFMTFVETFRYLTYVSIESHVLLSIRNLQAWCLLQYNFRFAFELIYILLKEKHLANDYWF